jgi:hypothetical protein
MGISRHGGVPGTAFSWYSKPTTNLDHVSTGVAHDVLTQRAVDPVHHPSPWSKRSGATIFALISLLVAAMVGSGLYRSSHRADVFTEASRSLDKSLTELPFTARLPQPAPAGARLVRVLMQVPDRKRGPSIYAIETTYTKVGARTAKNGSPYVRVWQTNDVYVRKQVLDPLGDRLDPRQFAGQTWYRRDGESLDRASGVSYTTRFSDGITMVVSGSDESMVLDSIAHLTKVTP